MAKVFKNPNFLDLNLHSQFDSYSSTVSRWNDAVLDYLTTPNEITDINAICISGLRTGQTNGSSTVQNDARLIEINGENHLVIKIKRTGVEAKCRPDFMTDAENNIQSEFLIGSVMKRRFLMFRFQMELVQLAPDRRLNVFADGRDVGLPKKTLFQSKFRRWQFF